LQLAFVDGHDLRSVTDLQLGSADFAEEQFVGFAPELDSGLEFVESVLEAAGVGLGLGPGSAVPEHGPAVPL
jgi:hypothetical protein